MRRAMMCLNLAMNEISRLQPFLLTKKRLDTGMSLNEQLLFTTVTSRSGIVVVIVIVVVVDVTLYSIRCRDRIGFTLVLLIV